MPDSDRRPQRRAQGELETQVLAALHAADAPATAGWVRDRVGGDLAYTTVMTILARLHAKDAVARRREGRSFLWTPTSDEAGLAALKMRKVLDAEPDREAVLASFLTSLPEGDEQVLRDLLRRVDEEDHADKADGEGAV
ncbi:BlaI/MecI/CopY family transcriptional regulator [Streptomyces sp. NBC_00006]|uniref:BlaI/MecI/CopY family transcriptional regulator n=1 Tax=unclassified Streptomyces TaxID=2593676 RepID=UPI00225AF300|nr:MULTISPECIES: BlaI/MecI/CopY family transcriptional regulator [unclassified Streptomyces]MCX4834178.1 BlaI/MecI/CopY family transcriptional regulator [Streptomyces sp. NBC_01016]MCX5529911.1 BlaI/MecI/CopY family transcriptional regulator [Streptomyces sp. NBC_00006]